MLREICCEEFYQKKIEFSNGLNVVLGTNDGDNSIGKSTFMLIIDFVFGGNTYSDSTDILYNVGSHNIYFKFEFHKQEYFFSRSNTDRNVVWKCDSNYVKRESISNEAYCKWLSEQYDINLNNLTFRDAVGRYIRAYGKSNCDEKHPLHVIQTEASSEAVIALLKLFDCYKIIAELEDKANRSKEALTTFNKAQSFNYIAKIGKRAYINNLKEIERLENEIEELSIELECGLLDVDSTASEEAVQIKKQLSRSKRLRSGVKSKLVTLDENSNYNFSKTTDTFVELEKFFPGVNIKNINEVEEFHQKVASIFKKEIREEKNILNKQLEDYNALISELENKLKELVQNPNLSKMILNKHANSLKLIEMMKRENEIHTKKEELKKTKENDAYSLQNIKSTQLAIIEEAINTEMEEINSLLYTEKFNAPIIHFKNSSYSFSTPNDTGTGIAYKGLVVFDLAIMHLTKLPILVHDSILLKQISDNAIENIINQYLACKKQVVIALDKQDSYSEKTTAMLEEYAILMLSPNGQELFGRSWGKE